MSQITRCPSCATMFKVVADQLRISDGWVRCGQCKQVFDAAAHLQAPSPAPLMQDLALDKLRPPPQPVRRVEPVAKTWGAVAASPERQSPVPSARAAASPPAGPGVTLAPEKTAAVLTVPDPGVPPFLALEPLPGQPGTDIFGRARTPEEPQPVASQPDVLASPPGANATGIEWPTIEFDGSAAQPVDPPAGYELPAPAWQETEFGIEPDADLSAALQPDKPWVPPAPLPDPPVERALRDALQDVLVQREALKAVQEPQDPQDPPIPLAASVEQTLRVSAEDNRGAGVVPMELSSVNADVPEEGIAPAVARAATQGLADPDEESLAGELSFVRAARRKAFWRKPLVRTGLGLVGLVLLVGLLLQVAVQERAFIAATWPQARSLLEALCQPLHCTVGPYRRIASVEVDGSSFHKVRGDEYQFALTLKNRAGIPVEMPAIELTLTDAQEQPVLRRVLPPSELAAPAELAAQEEWSATTAVLIASGGARITGYRVLAFYP